MVEELPMEIVSLNWNESTEADYPSGVAFRGELYITWIENTNIRVKKYDGTKWVAISSGLNYDTSKKAAGSPAAVVYKDELYIFWTEQSASGYYPVRAKKYDGSKWITADNNSGLNYTTKTAGHPYAVVYKDELYVVWFELNSVSKNQIRMKKTDGVNWYSADENYSLNFEPNQSADRANLAVLNDSLYLTWCEYDGSKNSVKMKRYNGSTWENKNFSQSRSTSSPSLAAYNNEVYCFWTETNGNGSNLTVKTFNGTSWASSSSILNYDPKASAQNCSPIVFNNELYVSWSEFATGPQIRLKKLVEGNWLSADNNSPLSYNSANSAVLPRSIVCGNKLYLTWRERNTANVYQIYVREVARVDIPEEAPIDNYVGLMFMDNFGQYYSTDKGDFLKYLEFGTVDAGEISEAQSVKLVNKHPNKVNNIILSLSNLSAPELTTIQLSKLEEPFTPVTNLSYSDVLEQGQEIVFYVRVSVDINTSPGKGQFDIDVVATSIS